MTLDELRFYIAPPQVTFFQTSTELSTGREVVHIVGVPMDDTVSYRPGTRFAPQILRQLSPYVEYTTSRGTVLDVMRHVRDLGDIVLYQGDVNKNIDRISRVAKLLNTYNINVLFVGGEHTITYAIARTFNNVKLLLIYFDAHLDFRNEWPLGQRYSHATHVRRLVEECDNVYVINIGARAYDIEEISEIRNRNNIKVISLDYIRDMPIGSISKMLYDIKRSFKPDIVYISIDVDVLRPEIVTTSNPEGDGLSYYQLYTILDTVMKIVGDKVRLVDIVEYNPMINSDRSSGVTVLKLIIDIVDLLCLYSLC